MLLSPHVGTLRHQLHRRSGSGQDRLDGCLRLAHGRCIRVLLHLDAKDVGQVALDLADGVVAQDVHRQPSPLGVGDQLRPLAVVGAQGKEHIGLAQIVDHHHRQVQLLGGLSQPTALRIRYLERVLAAYEREFGAPMPVDVWNIHNFILREEANSWGVGIPPGFDDTQKKLYEIADHDDMEIFAQQIINFRYWMWKQGQHDKPLIISEYGILMPPDYGFPAEAVKQFMWDSFDFFLNARDEEIGYPADDHRLVQQWCWYSLGDTLYYTSNLFDPQTFVITPLGEAFGEYVRTR